MLTNFPPFQYVVFDEIELTDLSIAESKTGGAHCFQVRIETQSTRARDYHSALTIVCTICGV